MQDPITQTTAPCAAAGKNIKGVDLYSAWQALLKTVRALPVKTFSHRHQKAFLLQRSSSIIQTGSNGLWLLGTRKKPDPALRHGKENKE
jgi:hypothetical protein